MCDTVYVMENRSGREAWYYVQTKRHWGVFSVAVWQRLRPVYLLPRAQLKQPDVNSRRGGALKHLQLRDTAYYVICRRHVFYSPGAVCWTQLLLSKRRYTEGGAFRAALIERMASRGVAGASGMSSVTA